MKLTKKQIKQIIENEIIVDCYDDEEINTGWATYLDDELNYPFTAEYQVEKTDGTKKQQTVKVIGDDSTGINYRGKDYHVKIELGEFVIAVKLTDLKNPKAEKETQIAMQVNEHRPRY